MTMMPYSSSYPTYSYTPTASSYASPTISSAWNVPSPSYNTNYLSSSTSPQPSYQPTMQPYGQVLTTYGTVPAYTTSNQLAGVQSLPAVVVYPQQRAVPQYVVVSPTTQSNPVGIGSPYTQSNPPGFGAAGYDYSDINQLFQSPLLQRSDLVNIPIQIPRTLPNGQLVYEPYNQGYIPALQPGQVTSAEQLMTRPAAHPGDLNALLRLAGVNSLIGGSSGSILPPVFFMGTGIKGGQQQAGLGY